RYHALLSQGGVHVFLQRAQQEDRNVGRGFAELTPHQAYDPVRIARSPDTEEQLLPSAAHLQIGPVHHRLWGFAQALVARVFDYAHNLHGLLTDRDALADRTPAWKEAAGDALANYGHQRCTAVVSKADLATHQERSAHSLEKSRADAVYVDLHGIGRRAGRSRQR